jgi:hypothetical protein
MSGSFANQHFASLNNELVVHPPRKKFFYVRVPTEKLGDVSTDAQMKLVKLDESAMISREVDAPLADAATIASTLEFQRVGFISWSNNPIELRIDDPNHPVSLDPGRLRACAGLIPDGPTSLSYALPTHSFYTKWLLPRDSIETKTSIAQKIHTQNSTPFTPSVITTGPFVLQLLPDPENEHAAMRLLVTIESEASLMLSEGDNFTRIEYTGAPNGVVFVANKNHPWVFAEVHAMGCTLMSEGGGDIGHSDRIVYLNAGLMSIVYEGDPGGILNNNPIVGKYSNKVQKTFDETNTEPKLISENISTNHRGLGSLGASNIRRFERLFAPEDNVLYNNKININGVFFQTIIEPTNGVNADNFYTSGAGNVNAFTPIPKIDGRTHTPKEAISSFLRFPEAISTKDENSSPLVVYAKILIPPGSDFSSAYDIRNAFGMNTKSATEAPSSAYPLLVPMGQNEDGTPNITGFFTIINTASTTLYYENIFPISKDIGLVKYEANPVPEKTIEVSWGIETTPSQEIKSPYPILTDDVADNYDQIYYCAFLTQLQATTSADIDACIRQIRPVFAFRLCAFESNAKGVPTTNGGAVKMIMETMSFPYELSSATIIERDTIIDDLGVKGASLRTNMIPLAPYISPTPLNHERSSLANESISSEAAKQSNQYVIGYPLGYHGSTLRGTLSSKATTVGVLGVRRLLVSTSETKDSSHGVVNFSYAAIDVVKPVYSDSTRPMTRQALPATYIVRDRMYAALMWEPAAFANAVGDFATITRPDGYVIRDIRDYTREVSIPSGILNTNIYSKTGNVTDTDISVALYHLNELNTPTSKIAKELWFGEYIFPLATAGGDSSKDKYIRNSHIRWGRQAYRYAKFIEIVSKGNVDFINQNTNSLTSLRKTRLTAQVSTVRDACINLWKGVRQILTTGIMPYWLPHTEALLGDANGTVAKTNHTRRVKSFKIVYDGERKTADLDANENSFLDEIKTWNQLRYDRTMCHEPRGVRPVWGGMTTRLHHEQRKWCVVADVADVATALDPVNTFIGSASFVNASSMVKHDAAGKYSYIPVRQLSDLEGPVNPYAFTATKLGLETRFSTDEDFSQYSNHHVVYGYILYVATIALRYGGGSTFIVEGVNRTISEDVESLLTETRETVCGDADPYPLMLLLLDFLAPVSEADAHATSKKNYNDIVIQKRLVDAIMSGMSPGDFHNLEIPDVLARGVRAPPSDDQIRRPFPPIRDFDLYQGHSWNVGPTLEFDGHMHEAPTESALAYYAAYQFVNQVSVSVNKRATNAMAGIILHKDNNGNINTTNPEVIPYTAIVALSHELASARSLRSTDSNKTMSDRMKEETFGASSALATLTNSIGGHPVFANWKVLEAVTRGFITSVDSTGVSRRTRFQPLARGWRRLPHSIPYHVATQCVPLVNGISAPITGAINDQAWAKFISDISSVGGIMRPQNMSANGVNVERFDYTTGLNRTKASVLSDYIFHILTYYNHFYNYSSGNFTDYGFSELSKDTENLGGGDIRYIPSPDLTEAARFVVAPLLHVVAGQIKEVGASITDIVFTPPSYAPFNTELYNLRFVSQTSWEDISIWFRAYKDRVYPVDNKPTEFTYSTNIYLDSDSRTPLTFYNILQAPYTSGFGAPGASLHAHYDPNANAAAKAFFGLPSSILTIKP